MKLEVFLVRQKGEGARNYAGSLCRPQDRESAKGSINSVHLDDSLKDSTFPQPNRMNVAVHGCAKVTGERQPIELASVLLS